MFTVEDVNGVVDELLVNGFHSVDTGLSDLGYFLADFVKVKRTASGFEFRVVNGLWTGGFYCTDSDGEYLDLGSSFSYSDGVLSVVTDESDVVLVLYLCSFFDMEDFDVQYLDCRLEDLDTVVGSVSVVVSDVTSLNGVAVVDSDISVSGGVVSVRGNTFYKDSVSLPPLPVITLGDSHSYAHCYAGAKHNSIGLVADISITGVTVEYLGKSVYVEFDGTSGTVDLDLTDYESLDPISLKVLVDDTDDSTGLSYSLEVPVNAYPVNSKEGFLYAVETKMRYIYLFYNPARPIIVLDSPVTIDSDVTIIKVWDYTPSLRFKELIISDGVNIEFKNINLLTHPSCDSPLLTLGENVCLNIEGCTIENQWDISMSSPSFIFANEDVTNTNSTVTITNSTFLEMPMPMIMFDGTLEIRDTIFRSYGYWGHYSFSSSSLKEEPCFIHMTDGKLTITNTSFNIETADDYIMEGYQICSILLGENTTFNGVTATNIDKDTGAKILSQNRITATTTGKYKNGDQTLNINGTFYGAVENRKITEWK